MQRLVFVGHQAVRVHQIFLILEETWLCIHLGPDPILLWHWQLGPRALFQYFVPYWLFADLKGI